LTLVVPVAILLAGSGVPGRRLLPPYYTRYSQAPALASGRVSSVDSSWAL